MNLDREDIQAIADEVERRVNQPVLVSPEWLAWKFSCSKRTIRRRRKEMGLAWRNRHAMPWEKGDGLKLLSLSEWKQQRSLSTQSIKHDLETSNHRIAA